MNGPNDPPLPLPSPDLLRKRPPPLAAPRPGSDYVLRDNALIAAATTAVTLGQPLILAGEPGVGKTRFARKFAQLCDVFMHPEVFVSTTAEGRGLLYAFDEVKRFRDEVKEPLASYVRLTSFGRAILWSAGPDAPAEFDPGLDPYDIIGHNPAGQFTLRDVFPGEFGVFDRMGCAGAGTHGGCESLVLLDEFDKAPRDAPNDLLGAVENMRFRIDEIGLEIAADAKAWPILLLTSNSERSLPDAFLRRCVFHWISFPDQDSGLLEEIIAMHCYNEARLRDGQHEASPQAQQQGRAEWRQSDFVQDAVELLYQLREDVVNKKPATAELLGFVSSLLAAGAQPGSRIDLDTAPVQQAIGALLKTKEDLRALGFLPDAAH